MKLNKNDITFYLISSAFFAMMASSGCTDTCETTSTYTYFEPVYATTQEVRDGFKIGEPAELNSPGKIYLYGQYVLINEPGEGVHIINNADNRNPVNEKFVNIPGNFDIAVKNNILYADSYVDLLAIDISDIENIRLITRLENVFPNYNIQFGFAADDGVVITGWTEVQQMEVTDDCRSTGGPILLGFGVAMADATVAASSSSSGPSTPTGIGGSMARFAIQSDFLYAVDSYNLNVFDISDTSSPEYENSVEVSWDVETIFPFKDKLFIGAQAGMFIFDTSTPASPAYVSSFLHVTACDPVVANDDYAFVTLRSGNTCQGFTNQLDVIDISSIENPRLHRTYQMQNPYGLGLDGDVLFICEAEFGLRVYDIADVDKISSNLIAVFNDINVFDVIPWQKVLLAVGEDGLYQYDYSDIENIELLSFIPILSNEK